MSSISVDKEGQMSGIKSVISSYNQTSAKHEQELTTSPYSGTYKRPEYDTKASDYGRPAKGSKTERRGIKAGNYVMREILFLCEILDQYGSPMQNEPEKKQIKFGPLFDLYSSYSDKLVGMLLRARKYGLVDFEGEMLYQRQDDKKDVTLLLPLQKIRASVKESNDPENCMKQLNIAKK